MEKKDRRTFLKQTGVGLAGISAVASAPSARAAKASGKLVIGSIGCGGQGTGLATRHAALPDVEVAYVCDPDPARAARAAKAVAEKNEGGRAPKIVGDLRAILDDKNVDAVTIGTPDHWHAPAAILACDAGKHVYVEKPCSHNIREGRLLVEAARRNNRIVQHGTQSRTDPLVKRGIQMLREGIIGDVLVSKAWNVQRRGEIGHASPEKPPENFDYDMWLGPAPFVRFQKNRHHYTWHWWYDFGTGDMGNDGVHEIDIARWGLGVDTHPSKVSAAGGKYSFDDDQEFPDTQYVSFEYPGNGRPGNMRQLVFEQRLWSRYGSDGIDNGNAFYGTKGWMLLSKRGVLKVYDEKNNLVKSDERGDASLHPANFVAAIRSGSPPAAEIEIGHLSATLCHLGNIATRVGRTLTFDPKTERIVRDKDADRLTKRTYRDHWAVPKDV